MLNPANMAPGDDQHVTIAELSNLDSTNNMDWTREPDRVFFLGMDILPINNLHFHDPEYYPIFGGSKKKVSAVFSTGTLDNFTFEFCITQLTKITTLTLVK